MNVGEPEGRRNPRSGYVTAAKFGQEMKSDRTSAVRSDFIFVCCAVPHLLLTSWRRPETSARDAVHEARVLHLFPRLIAPLHFDGRIGIVLVGRRVVVPRRRADLRAGGNLQRLVEQVVRLP